MKLLILLISVLTVYSAVPQLNDGNFMSTVSEDPLQMWMVFFHADWCQLCKQLLPQFEKASQLMHNMDFKFATFNEKGNPKTVSSYVADPKTHMLEYPSIVVLAGSEAIGKVPGQIRNSYGMQHWFLNYFKVVDE